MLEALFRGHLSGLPALRVLEIGPGYGSFGQLACEITGARHLTVVDVDPRVLDWQREQSRRLGIETRTVAALLTPGELAAAVDDSYDVILCQEVLEHLPDAEEVFRVIAKRLSPGGRVIITVPTSLSERWLTWLNPSYMREAAHGHVRRFDRGTLSRLVTSAGLEILTLVPTQPHFFLTHTWIFGLRMSVEASTGRILSTGWRRTFAEYLNAYSREFFRRTGPGFWSQVLPRNYFLVGRRR